MPPYADPRDAPDGAPQPRRTLRRGVAVAVEALLLSSVAVLALVVVDRTPVADRDGLARVELGRPLTWVTQDQTGRDPALPASRSLLSPWEHPTTVRTGPFAADVTIIGAGLLVMLWAAGRIGRRVDRRR